jgi:hypothetical protein
VRFPAEPLSARKNSASPNGGDKLSTKSFAVSGVRLLFLLGSLANAGHMECGQLGKVSKKKENRP